MHFSINRLGKPCIFKAQKTVELKTHCQAQGFQVRGGGGRGDTVDVIPPSPLGRSDSLAAIKQLEREILPDTISLCFK